MTDPKLNLFITGANGFVGKNISEYIRSVFPGRYAVFGPAHRELDLLEADKVEAFMRENRIDRVIHCANVGGSRKTAYDAGTIDVVEKNLRMFFNLARCLGPARKMIHFGSGAQYGMKHYRPAMMEDYFGLHVPEDSYGFSKYVISNYIQKTDRILELRIFGMFGIYEDYDYKFISNAIVKNLFHLPIVINQNVYFDYMYIKDAVKLVERFLSADPAHKAYNLTTGKTVDLLTIANTINEVSDFKSEIIVKNSGLNVEYSGDNQRLMREMKFDFTSLRDSVRELVGYYRGIMPQIDRSRIETDEFIKFCKIVKN